MIASTSTSRRLGLLSRGVARRLIARPGIGECESRDFRDRQLVMTIYVGNLPYATTDAELVELFVPFGDVLRVTIVTHRDTGRSRGFGFVEMNDATEGRAAIAALADTEPLGRPLTVNEARPRGSGTGQRIIGDGAASRNDDRHQRQDQDQPHRKGPSAIPDHAARPVSAGYHNRFRATR